MTSAKLTQAVLVVDDDRSFRELATDILTRAGHPVVAVPGATRGLEEYARRVFELVVVDLLLSGVDGLQLVAAIREHHPDQEVILVSARQDLSDSLRALRAGVADYLIKPIDEAELVRSVDRCLARAALRRDRERLLNENLDLARYQSIQGRCLELLANPDLESLQESVLAELTSICDAQSAALWVANDRGELHLRAYRGLLDRRRLPPQLTAALLDPMRIRDGNPWTTSEGPARTLHVPMRVGGELVALAQLSDPLAGDFRPDHVRAAQMLAAFAAIAVRNAARTQALQRLGLRDRETAAYNLSYFVDYASKEIYKARRYGRTFSLLIFSIDNLANVKLTLGATEARRAIHGIIRALSGIIRDADVLAAASEQELYLLLPETDLFGALMFDRRAIAASRDDADVKEIERRVPTALVGGAASFPKDGEDFDELVYRCRRRMEERRLSLQRTLALDGLPFWDEVELLLGSAQSPSLPVEERGEPSRRGMVSDVLFDELQAEIARELLRDPGARGLLYVGGPEVRSDMPVATQLEEAPPDLGSRVYVLGRRRDLRSHPALTPVFLEGDERMGRHEFLLWLSESSAYALLQRRGKGATWGFHTSDPSVVDGLIGRLQAEYDLQPW
jgi:two-component system cell cycle response regulator